jgi:L-asparagine transporter-like permease
MDKSKKVKVASIIIGSSLVILGIYLTFSSITHIFTAVTTIGGLALISYGFRYDAQNKSEKKKIEKLEQKVYSESYITTLTGVIILLIFIAISAIATSLHASAIAVISLLIAFVGIIIFFAGRVLEAEKQS